MLRSKEKYKEVHLLRREGRSVILETSEISLSTRRCVALGIQLRFTLLDLITLR